MNTDEHAGRRNFDNIFICTNIMKKDDIYRPLWLILFSAVAIFAHAAQRSLQAATDIASKYFAKPELITRSTLKPEGEPTFFIFTNAAHKGFVIVSGESDLPQVLGYGSHFTPNDARLPDYFYSLLRHYELMVQAYRCRRLVFTNDRPRVTEEIPPLLSCTWNQEMPFKRHTPKHNNTNMPTGCVATALSQLMYHNKWPIKRPTQFVNPTGTVAQKSNVYLWKSIKDKGSLMSDAEKDAVGVLLSDVGKAVNMKYDTYGSTSNMQWALDALRKNFDYSVKHLNKEYMPKGMFYDMVLDELAHGYPVLIGESNHSFLIDGIDKQGYVHVNWGWAGENDGWFDFATLYTPLDDDVFGTDLFALEMEAVLAHPKNSHHKQFKVVRELEVEAVDAFRFLQHEVPRNFPIQASIKNIGTYNECNGELGLFTGKVGLALYNKKGKLVKVVEFKDPALQWNSMFVTKDLRFNNINLSDLPNGKYTVKPVSNELVARPDKFSGWQPIAYSNCQTLVLSKHKVSVEPYEWKDKRSDYSFNANATLSGKGK